MNTLSPTDIRERLAARGLRCTLQRERLYGALMASKTHPTADELFRAVRADTTLPAISLATVYNTLEAFTRAGLARRIAPGALDHNGAYRYDADTAYHVHVTTASGQVRDVPDHLGRMVLESIPADLIERIEHATGVRITRVSVEFIEEPAPDPELR